MKSTFRTVSVLSSTCPIYSFSPCALPAAHVLSYIMHKQKSLPDLKETVWFIFLLTFPMLVSLSSLMSLMKTKQQRNFTIAATEMQKSSTRARMRPWRRILMVVWGFFYIIKKCLGVDIISHELYKKSCRWLFKSRVWTQCFPQIQMCTLRMKGFIRLVTFKHGSGVVRRKLVLKWACTSTATATLVLAAANVL